MPRSNEQSLKEAINRLLETHQLKNKLGEVKLVANWEQLMGKTIARYTKDIYIRNKKLYLKIESAPLRQELSFAKEKIIELLNKDAGEQLIEEVVFF